MGFKLNVIEESCRIIYVYMVTPTNYIYNYRDFPVGTSSVALLCRNTEHGPFHSPCTGHRRITTVFFRTR